jgi:hypothetical protein
MSARTQGTSEEASTVLVFTKRSEIDIMDSNYQKPRFPIGEALGILANCSVPFVVMIANGLDGDAWADTLCPHLERFEMAFLFSNTTEIKSLANGFESVVFAVNSPRRIVAVVVDFDRDISFLRHIDGYCVANEIPVAAIARDPVRVPIRAFPPKIYSRAELGNPKSRVGQHLGILVAQFFFQVKLHRCDDLIELKLYDMAVVNSAIVIEQVLRELAKKFSASSEVVLARSIWTVVDFLAKAEKKTHPGLVIDRDSLERVTKLGNAVRHQSYTPTAEEAKGAYGFARQFIYSNIRPDLRGAGIIPGG